MQIHNINASVYIINIGGINLSNIFISAGEVAQELGISKPQAYKIIKGWNEDLKAKGFLVISGKVNRRYYQEKLYGGGKGSDGIASV